MTTAENPVTDGEIAVVVAFIETFRERYSRTQAIGAATVALGLPALGQVQRIGLVLAEMQRRGLLVHVYDIEGAPCYMELTQGHSHS